MPRYLAKAKREAVALYETGLSCRAVAEQLRVKGLPWPSHLTVLRWAKEAGKSRRTHGHRLPLSGETVHALYDGGMDVEGIAYRFQVGTTTIYSRLHEASAGMRPSRIKYGHVLTKRRLRALYMHRNLRAQDIASKFGCDTGTVYNWLRRTGVPLKRPRRSPETDRTGRLQVAGTHNLHPTDEPGTGRSK